MPPDVLKIMASVAGALIAAPLIAATMRAFFFFGSMSKTVERMGRDLEESTKTMVGFQSKVTELLEGHEIRLTRIEEARRVEAAYGRRASDQPPDDVSPSARK